MKNILTAIALIFTANSYATPPVKYIAGVHDATEAETSELVDTLDALDPSNNTLVWNADKTLIKVVTWKSQSSYERFLLPFSQTSDNEANVVWVSLAPKIQAFCRNYMQTHQKATKEKLDLRLKQHLGLNSDWSYDIFVELWVNPNDVFRPCVDPNPNDTRCDLNFGTTIPTVKNIKDYKAFYQNIYYKSFREAPGVPWTGLGYTYDWKDIKHEQGASEFILSPSTAYTIEHAVPTMDYCAAH